MEQTIWTPTNPVPFPIVWADYKTVWDAESNAFKVPKSTYYYVSVSGGAQGGQAMNFGFQENSGVNLVSLVRRSNVHNGPDLVSRDTIASLKEDKNIQMLTRQGALYSDAEHQTALTVFNMDDVSRDPEVFMCASRDSSFSTQGKVEFTRDYITFQYFNTTTNTFTCPETGYYFFNLATGLESRATADIQLKHNIYTFGMTRTSSSHNNLDTISRSAMFRCQQGEQVYVHLESGSLFGSYEIPISLNGFLYKPRHRNPVAWAAYRVSSWESNDDVNDPIAFDEILVNAGDDFKENKFQCRVSGYYFIYMGVGVKKGQLVNYNLMLNGKRIADVYRNTRYHNGNDMMGRSLIQRLKVNDVLHVSADVGTAFYSTGYRQTCFIGMLLYTVP
jgi:hypothetical protein